VGILSLVGLVPAFKILSSDLAHSGFYEYLSLTFEGGGVIISYWKELSLSIVESIPVMSTLLTLSLLFVCLLSLKYLTRQIIRNKLLAF